MNYVRNQGRARDGVRCKNNNKNTECSTKETVRFDKTEHGVRGASFQLYRNTASNDIGSMRPCTEQVQVGDKRIHTYPSWNVSMNIFLAVTRGQNHQRLVVTARVRDRRQSLFLSSVSPPRPVTDVDKSQSELKESNMYEERRKKRDKSDSPNKANFIGR